MKQDRDRGRQGHREADGQEARQRGEAKVAGAVEERDADELGEIEGADRVFARGPERVRRRADPACAQSVDEDREYTEGEEREDDREDRCP